jgi:hypothetical protein
MSLFDVIVMLLIRQEISFVVVMLSLSMTATKSKKMMSDLNFNPIPSEIKYFIPGKETVNDIPSLFGSLQKMDRFQSCHDFILVEYNCFFGLVGLSLHVTECLFNSFSFQFYFILQFLRMFSDTEHQTKMTCLFCRTCDHLVCTDCISSKHNNHKFEPVETILSEKLDELKGAEARYSKDFTLCQAKVEEFQISEAKCESLFDETIHTR